MFLFEWLKPLKKGHSFRISLYKINLEWSGESLGLIYNQFGIIRVLQKSPILQTINWSWTFFVVSYSKPALTKGSYGRSEQKTGLCTVLATYLVRSSKFFFNASICSKGDSIEPLLKPFFFLKFGLNLKRGFFFSSSPVIIFRSTSFLQSASPWFSSTWPILKELNIEIEGNTILPRDHFGKSHFGTDVSSQQHFGTCTVHP